MSVLCSLWRGRHLQRIIHLLQEQMYMMEEAEVCLSSETTEGAQMMSWDQMPNFRQLTLKEMNLWLYQKMRYDYTAVWPDKQTGFWRIDIMDFSKIKMFFLLWYEKNPTLVFDISLGSLCMSFSINFRQCLFLQHNWYVSIKNLLEIMREKSTMKRDKLAIKVHDTK